MFVNFESYKLPTAAQQYPFRRQKLSNSSVPEEEITLSLNDVFQEVKTKMENCLPGLPGSAIDPYPLSASFDFRQKQFEEEAGESVFGVKFPHYVKMCPYPHDELAKIPIIKAVDMIQWMYRTFLCAKSPTDYIKDALKSDITAIGKFDELCGPIGASMGELADKLTQSLGEPLGEDPDPLLGKPVAAKDWLAEYRKLVRDHVVRTQQMFVQDLVLNEKRINREANLLGIYGNMKFQCAALAVASEIVGFIHNSTQLNVPSIHKCCGTSFLETWKLIGTVLSVVSSMPPALRTHLRELEQSILKSRALAEDSEFALHVRGLVPADSRSLQVRPLIVLIILIDICLALPRDRRPRY